MKSSCFNSLDLYRSTRMQIYLCSPTLSVWIAQNNTSHLFVIRSNFISSRAEAHLQIDLMGHEINTCPICSDCSLLVMGSSQDESDDEPNSSMSVFIFN